MNKNLDRYMPGSCGRSQRGFEFGTRDGALLSGWPFDEIAGTHDRQLRDFEAHWGLRCKKSPFF